MAAGVREEIQGEGWAWQSFESEDVAEKGPAEAQLNGSAAGRGSGCRGRRSIIKAVLWEGLEIVSRGLGEE